MRWRRPVPERFALSHSDVTVRVGDDAAESHAFARARKIIKSDDTMWKREVLMEEIERQLVDAADGECPQCARRRGN
jgi:hypothetical protein